MSIDFKTLDEAIKDNGVKILTHGPAGSGKTVLCATAGMSTILLSAEGGLLSLKKYMRENPKSAKLIKIIEINSFGDLEDTLDMLQENDQLADWVMLDSISEIAEQILNHEKKNNKDPRAAYGNLTDSMLDHMRSFRDLAGYNVHMTCKQVREVDGDTEKTRFVPLFPGRQVGPAIPYLFDEVFALRVEEDEENDNEKYRILQTDRDAHYEAKDRSGELEIFEEPNLKDILYKIHPDYILLKDRDEKPKQEEPEEEKKPKKDKKKKKNKKNKKVEKEPEISVKRQYWQHPDSGELLHTDKGHDLSGVRENKLIEIPTKLKYEKALSKQKQDQESED